MRQSVVIENPKTSEDWSAIYRLCCETGNNGAPIDVSRHPFFGEYWVGPYKKLRARWCYLAKDSSGQVLGYLTGAPDTLAFEQQKRIHFTAPLFFRVAFGQYGWTSDVKRFIKRTLRFEQGPVDRFAVGDRALANQRFPAHLHMNVASHARGLAVGTQLLEKFCADLRAEHVGGIHLYCGADPVAFYQRQGFKISSQINTSVSVFLLTLAL